MDSIVVGIEKAPPGIAPSTSLTISSPPRPRNTSEKTEAPSFRTVEELRPAMIDFKQTCNEHWLIERHNHRSPAQFRRDQVDTLPLAA